MDEVTEAQFQELRQRAAGIGQALKAALAAGRPRHVTAKRPESVSGPLSVLLTLHGHCPSKKNLWLPNASGGFRLAGEVKEQIDLLTTQALFGWKRLGPAEHPDLTVTFYVHHARRDRDGMLVTVLDCLQQAGVLVNDNLAHANGRLVLEPAVFVAESEQRVEILVEKK